MRIGVLANCQRLGFADCVAALLPGHEMRVVGIGQLDRTSDLAAIADDLAACDLLFTQNLTAEWLGPLAMARLMPRAARAVVFPSIAFTGFQPDSIVGPEQGLMGVAHSALAMACHAEGLPPDRAVRLFNAFTYGALGYFDQHDISFRFMTREARALGYDFGALIREAPGVFMHTTNHPRIDVLMAVARAAVARAGEPLRQAPLPHDRLEDIALWPVYPEIAARLGVAGGLTFGAGARRFELREMVERSYDTYRQMGDFVRPPAIARARALIRERILGLPPPGVAIEDVRMAYRMILGRDCESDAVAADHARRYASIAAMREAFLRSAEFRLRHAAAISPPSG